MNLLAAIDLETLVGIGIAIFMVGGWIADVVKKSRSGGPAGPIGAPRRQRARLDQIAAERRRKLQQMSQQRSGELAPPPRPTNLTTAELEERIRAKEAYEARAAQLRSPQQPSPQPAQPPRRKPRRPPAAPAPPPAPVGTPIRPGLGDGVRSVRSQREETDTGESVVHRHVEDAAAATPRAELKPVITAAGVRKNLRAAFVLKEVLDPPLALRD